MCVFYKDTFLTSALKKNIILLYKKVRILLNLLVAKNNIQRYP